MLRDLERISAAGGLQITIGDRLVDLASNTRKTIIPIR